ncbi:MAG: DEAD/DEAH box helicase [Anaerolineae bacterium]|nr:DEAD/DEAH box helicase [Anaerolineae bacterium]
MDAATFLKRITELPGYRDQIVHVQSLPGRKARYGRLRRPLPRPLAQALRATGVHRLYSHQAAAINAVREGHNVILATATASGKTLTYNVPVLEAILQDPEARALYLFPTKALAQDQLRALRELTAPLGEVPMGTYDGDTPRGARAALRRRARILLTNPDMLSLGILPNHSLWSHFLANLKFVVLDEAHVYRGVFGSQVACVLRRLWRLCRFYGAEPQFILCSATIANPGEHAQRLTGQPVQVVDDDGAPQGPRLFALWNPPYLDKARSVLRSPNSEATFLLVALVRAGLRCIVFTRTRRVAELILRYARQALEPYAPALARRIKAYRAGYRPEHRREIERELFRGELLGVTATSALELGIDVGDLDAAVLVGYPGSIASLWQRVGRAGRRQEGGLAILIGTDNPLDQYFMRHPKELFSRPHEQALIRPDNRYILRQHLPCAAYELPLTTEASPRQTDDEALFGPGFVEAVLSLEQEGLLEYRDGRWFYRGLDYPAEQVNLRSAGGRRFALLNEADGYRTLEEIEASSAPYRVHPGAIYLHQGETYLVTRLDLDQGFAILRPVEVDYYTQPREVNDVHVVRSFQHAEHGAATAFLGEVRVVEQVVGYKRVQQYTEMVLSQEWLDLPPQSYTTMALWFDVPPEWGARLAAQGRDFHGALHALEHASIGMLPLLALCDRADIGGLSTPRHPDTDRPQIFLYDAFPGGVGIAERGFEELPALWQATLELVRTCPCEEGCPSCVQSPKCGNNNEPLDKEGAALLLEWLLGKG